MERWVNIKGTTKVNGGGIAKRGNAFISSTPLVCRETKRWSFKPGTPGIKRFRAVTRKPERRRRMARGKHAIQKQRSEE